MDVTTIRYDSFFINIVKKNVLRRDSLREQRHLPRTIHAKVLFDQQRIGWLIQMSENCSMCGRKIHLIKTKVKDGFICGGCVDRLTPNLYATKENYTGSQLEDIIRKKEAVADARKHTPVPVPVTLPFNVPSGTGGDKFEEVRRYKELLDDGIITEEEFDKKRRELLGL